MGYASVDVGSANRAYRCNPGSSAECLSLISSGAFTLSPSVIPVYPPSSRGTFAAVIRLLYHTLPHRAPAERLLNVLRWNIVWVGWLTPLLLLSLLCATMTFDEPESCD